MTSKFWTTYLKSIRAGLLIYLGMLALVWLLTILYRVPKAFLLDTVRFSLPLIIVWLVYRLVRAAQRVKKIGRQSPAPKISPATPTEDALLTSLEKQRTASTQTISDLRQRQRKQLDHLDLYAHEIKNDLLTLKAAAENRAAVSSAAVQAATRQANYYLDLLLNDERLNMDKHDFDFHWVSLEKLVNELLQQNSVLFIHHQLVPNLGDLNVKVLTDQKWLRFCINQLLSNAIKYSPAGASIDIAWQDDRLVIADHGTGISSSDLPRIYEDGFTGQNGHRTSKSTGMGLYLVKKISDQLNFRVEIVSKEGQGTTAALAFDPQNVRQH
ncbi:sensor histidine kinase [Limosilactobacillus sp.]|jgi:signal transduction histidine kinase|uniref:sensor histidine kinase n=1 Tax=Limosilactobacillus sp. TaxID=2773925 RepID=UPI0025BD73E6|nr:sensor histidine kinase [Limosilactobacillus sp.]MCH3922891.1 sensor histidine kinase [Limosilactobacillus sp.]MCH3927574.1 sensor histidine kinase [Limosilactobacillus sp.]